MAEETWVDGVSGIVASSEILLAANTAVNVYGHLLGDNLALKKKGPNAKFYPHKMNGSSNVGNNDSSFIVLTPGTYKIVGSAKGPLFITHEAL